MYGHPKCRARSRTNAPRVCESGAHATAAPAGRRGFGALSSRGARCRRDMCAADSHRAGWVRQQLYDERFRRSGRCDLCERGAPDTLDRGPEPHRLRGARAQCPGGLSRPGGARRAVRGNAASRSAPPHRGRSGSRGTSARSRTPPATTDSSRPRPDEVTRKAWRAPKRPCGQVRPPRSPPAPACTRAGSRVRPSPETA
jgi:hypothetical protein